MSLRIAARSCGIAAGRVAMALACAVLLVSQAVAAGLSKDSAMALMELRAADQKVVSLAVISVPGRSGAVAAATLRAGGRVRYHFEPADFVSVALPVDKVSEFLQLPSIEVAGIDLPDAEYRYRGLAPERPEAAGADRATSADGSSPRQPAGAGRTASAHAPAAAEEWPPKLSAYPLEHPYDVLSALGASDFRRRHPTFDGRGVVIAQVEAMSDMLLPELRTALDIHGREVPKFLDVLNNPAVKASLDAEADRADWQWVKLGERRQAKDGQLEHAGKVLRTPAASGRYRLGMLEIPTHLLTPINLPGQETTQSAADYQSLLQEGSQKKATPFAVLWSDEQRTAWLDSDRDGDFTDEQAVREYRGSYDIGVLGRDDPTTERRESRPYTIQKDGAWLSVNLDCNPHATMVAGAAAASRGSNGRMDGIAPGAQVIAIRHGTTFSAFAWSLIAAFADPRSDIVLVEASFPPTGGHVVKDGRSLLGEMTSRLSRRYGKPSFWTAGNESFMSAIIDASIAPETISIGAYDTQESFRVHFGVRLPWQETVHAIGSEGPAGNGGLKPDLLSPSMMIGLRDGFLGDDSLSTLPGLYRLPTGYWVTGGTSAATPIASGAAALLVSAAKQRGLSHGPENIKRALMASAEYLPGAGSYQQGAGVIRVGAAWERLEAQAKEREVLSIDVVAPVKTANSHLLPTPHEGVGIFEREGWRAGDRGTRQVTLTRRNGPSGPMRFTARWQGNQDGAFSVARDVQLPLGKPVDLEIAIAPQKEGVYSATLQLFAEAASDKAAAPAVRVPVTVVVPYELDKANGFAQEQQVEVPILGRKAVFVRVPEGAGALTVEVSHTNRETPLVLQDPSGKNRGFYVQHNPVTGKSIETIPLPEAGVWGLSTYNFSGRGAWFGALANSATHQGAAPPVSMSLRVSAAAVSITADAKALPLSGDEVLGVSVSNTLGDLEQAAITGRVAAVRRAEGQLARGEHRMFDIEVPAGVEFLVAEVEGMSAEPALGRAQGTGAGPELGQGASLTDTDLYLFDCTGKQCLLVRAGRGYGSSERVAVQDPKPGRWRVMLDASTSAAGRVRYRYTDLYTVPEAGVVSVIDPPAGRAAGSAWKARVRPWVTGVTGNERQPAAMLFVHDPVRTSRLDIETSADVFGCKTYPYCGKENRESALLGMTLLDLAVSGDGSTSNTAASR